MSSREYWDSDSTLVKDYRKADEISRKRKNQELWLQGMYVYEAICCASPLMQPFAKKGTKPFPYTTEPYPLTEKEQADRKAREEKKAIQEGIDKMKQFANDFNTKFENKKGR